MKGLKKASEGEQRIKTYRQRLVGWIEGRRLGHLDPEPDINKFGLSSMELFVAKGIREKLIMESLKTPFR